MKQKGMLMVISGPSATGKSTIVKEYLKRNPQIKMSVSATTRQPRPGETDGVNYFFLNKDVFRKRLENGEFLEHAQVYGNYYGTPKAYVEEQMTDGKDVLLEIDTEGAMQVREKFAEGVFLFVIPPSLEALNQRINYRGTETAAEMNQRLNNALLEIEQLTQYDYVVMNKHVDDAVGTIESIMLAEKTSVARCGWYWVHEFTKQL